MSPSFVENCFVRKDEAKVPSPTSMSFSTVFGVASSARRCGRIMVILATAILLYAVSVDALTPKGSEQLHGMLNFQNLTVHNSFPASRGPDCPSLGRRRFECDFCHRRRKHRPVQRHLGINRRLQSHESESSFAKALYTLREERDRMRF